MTDWRKLLTDEHLWDYRCKAVPVPLVREIVEEVETLRQDLAAARAELADMRVELDAARDNCEEWVKKYKTMSSKFNWDKSSDANADNWR